MKRSVASALTVASLGGAAEGFSPNQTVSVYPPKGSGWILDQSRSGGEWTLSRQGSWDLSLKSVPSKGDAIKFAFKSAKGEGLMQCVLRALDKNPLDDSENTTDLQISWTPGLGVDTDRLDDAPSEEKRTSTAGSSDNDSKTSKDKPKDTTKSDTTKTAKKIIKGLKVGMKALKTSDEVTIYSDEDLKASLECDFDSHASDHSAHSGADSSSTASIAKAAGTVALVLSFLR